MIQARFCAHVALLVAALFLSACAGTPRYTDAEVARIYEVLRASAAAESTRCLSTSRYQSVEVIDDRHLLFKGSGNRGWVNELRNRCPGLRRNDVLLFELNTSQVCQLDTVTTIDRGMWIWRNAGPTCTLGPFRQIDAEQRERIEEVLDGS